MNQSIKRFVQSALREAEIKFVDWDVPAAMLDGLWLGYCVCCLNYKRKEVEGRELKLHRLTADKKLQLGGHC